MAPAALREEHEAQHRRRELRERREGEQRPAGPWSFGVEGHHRQHREHDDGDLEIAHLQRHEHRQAAEEERREQPRAVTVGTVGPPRDDAEAHGEEHCVEPEPERPLRRVVAVERHQRQHRQQERRRIGEVVEGERPVRIDLAGRPRRKPVRSGPPAGVVEVGDVPAAQGLGAHVRRQAAVGLEERHAGERLPIDPRRVTDEDADPRHRQDRRQRERDVALEGKATAALPRGR